MANDSWEFNAPTNDEDDTAGGRKKRLLKKAPDAPKRFKTAYICFVMDKMDSVKEKSPKDEKVLIVVEQNETVFIFILFPQRESRFCLFRLQFKYLSSRQKYFRSLN